VKIIITAEVIMVTIALIIYSNLSYNNSSLNRRKPPDVAYHIAVRDVQNYVAAYPDMLCCIAVCRLDPICTSL